MRPFSTSACVLKLQLPSLFNCKAVGSFTSIHLWRVRSERPISCGHDTDDGEQLVRICENKDSSSIWPSEWELLHTFFFYLSRNANRRHWDVLTLLLSPLQTFLRVRANRHTRLNGTLILEEWTEMLCFLAAESVCGYESSKVKLSGHKFKQIKKIIFIRSCLCSHSSKSPPSPVIQISPLFPHHLSWPSAPTSRGAINLSTLTSWYVNSRWPLLVQVLRQICPITPPQRRSPPRLRTSW